LTLRWYQKEAADVAWDWVRQCIDPCVIEAATGAGKSHIIAALAERIHAHSKKRVLCIAPSSELVEQNYKKYLDTGNKASIFSASVRKEMRYPVIFGTPGTVINAIRRFQDFAAVIVDEAHGVTPTLIKIIESMQQSNPKLRVIGLSATPYRLGTGYIYARGSDGTMVDEAISPFFHTRVYCVDAKTLIGEGFLTQPVFDNHADGYDTSALVLKSNGMFDSATVERAFEGHGRKTASIVADVVERSRYRRGVMLFAATVQHAKEIIASLPPDSSRMIGGDVNTGKTERRALVDDFKAMRYKYLVSVGTMTTGVDFTHVDVIAILRATESVSLLQQIIGRGLRIHEGKRDCLILDYAENVERHCPNGDVFSPVVVARISKGGDKVSIVCPSCTYENQFALRPNPDEYPINKDGYWTDLSDTVITNSSGVPVPGHLGRRCNGQVLIAGRHERCHQKWSAKECPECQHENDIAARYCQKCRAEIVDPNDKLKEIAAQIARDANLTKCADVTGIEMSKHFAPKGECLKVTYHIDGKPHKLTEYFHPESSNQWLANRWVGFCLKAWGERLPDIQSALDMKSDANMPSQLYYRKKEGTQWHEVIGGIWNE